MPVFLCVCYNARDATQSSTRDRRPRGRRRPGSLRIDQRITGVLARRAANSAVFPDQGRAGFLQGTDPRARRAGAHGPPHERRNAHRGAATPAQRFATADDRPHEIPGTFCGNPAGISRPRDHPPWNIHHGHGRDHRLDHLAARRDRLYLPGDRHQEPPDLGAIARLHAVEKPPHSLLQPVLASLLGPLRMGLPLLLVTGGTIPDTTTPRPSSKATREREGTFGPRRQRNFDGRAIHGSMVFSGDRRGTNWAALISRGSGKGTDLLRQTPAADPLHG